MFLLARHLLRRHRARRAAAATALGGDGAAVAAPRRPPARAASRPERSGSRGPFALVLHQARYDLRAFLRNKQGRFFTLALPVIFLVIFVGVFGNHRVGPEQVKASTYYVPGLSAMAVIAASFVNLVISTTGQRESGVLKRRRAAPVPASVVIAGRTLAAIAVSLTTLVVLLLVGRFVYGVHLRVGAIPGVALTAIVGSVTFCILAYALTSVISSADAAQPTVQALMLPLYFISGVFVPNVNLPGWLRQIAEIFPVQHLADGLHHAYDPAIHGSGISWTDLAVLGAWAVAGLVVALRRFTWSPVTANA